ncbi:MAG: hypothetical protein U5L76_01775 [Patescibacteria group bacterium]|nr:hypothetical protein [Patescibacteria group bacterium]
MNFLTMFPVILVLVLMIRQDFSQRIISHKIKACLTDLSLINMMKANDKVTRIIVALALFIIFYLVNYAAKRRLKKEIIGGANLLLIANLSLLFGSIVFLNKPLTFLLVFGKLNLFISPPAWWL